MRQYGRAIIHGARGFMLLQPLVRRSRAIVRITSPVRTTRRSSQARPFRSTAQAKATDALDEATRTGHQLAVRYRLRDRQSAAGWTSGQTVSSPASMTMAKYYNNSTFYIFAMPRYSETHDQPDRDLHHQEHRCDRSHRRQRRPHDSYHERRHDLHRYLCQRQHGPHLPSRRWRRHRRHHSSDHSHKPHRHRSLSSRRSISRGPLRPITSASPATRFTAAARCSPRSPARATATPASLLRPAYSYYVRATDAAGNLSGNSNTASATTQAPPAPTPLLLPP